MSAQIGATTGGRPYHYPICFLKSKMNQRICIIGVIFDKNFYLVNSFPTAKPVDTATPSNERSLMTSLWLRVVPAANTFS